MTQVILTLANLQQAQVIREALDLYTRVGLGQLQMIEELFRKEDVPTARDVSFDERMAMAEHLLAKMGEAKQALGFTANSSLGIGNERTPIGAKRAYEVLKVLDKALAEHRNPTPDFRGVHYDGLVLRYTSDPLPTAVVLPAPSTAD